MLHNGIIHVVNVISQMHYWVEVHTYFIFELGINHLDDCTKTLTPYGIKLSWKLSIPKETSKREGMTFTIHMKDTKKVGALHARKVQSVKLSSNQSKNANF